MNEPVVEELRDAGDPPAVLGALLGTPHPVLLESASAVGGAGRWSFLSADPFAVLADPGGTGLAAIGRFLERYRCPAVPGLPPFRGGLIGYLGYELAWRLERLPAPRPNGLGLPQLWLGAYDWAIAWDHVQGRAWIVSTGLPERGAAGRRRARARVDWVRNRLIGVAAPSYGAGEGGHPGAAADDRHSRSRAPSGAAVPAGGVRSAVAAVGRNRARAPAAANGGVPSHPVAGLPGVRSTFHRCGYLAAVERVRKYIRAGDIFQANLSQRLSAELEDGPFDLYLRLRRRNPAPFAAFLDLGDGAAVVSASPERFLRVDGDAVETRPIKGTAARRADPEADEAAAATLLASRKDRAENVMIVDLLRNDLSRVCEDGSVRVDSLCALERHPTVHHLVSVVTARLRPGASALDLLTAAFPGGSITGAPKLRAVEILRDLEPTPRGVYTGAVGYLGFDGSMDTSIAIRTFVVRGRQAWFGVGGAIVLDSEPDAEYEETLAKARGLAAAVPALAPTPAEVEASPAVGPGRRSDGP